MADNGILKNAPIILTDNDDIIRIKAPPKNDCPPLFINHHPSNIILFFDELLQYKAL